MNQPSKFNKIPQSCLANKKRKGYYKTLGTSVLNKLMYPSSLVLHHSGMTPSTLKMFAGLQIRRRITTKILLLKVQLLFEFK